MSDVQVCVMHAKFGTARLYLQSSLLIKLMFFVCFQPLSWIPHVELVLYSVPCDPMQHTFMFESSVSMTRLTGLIVFSNIFRRSRIYFYA